MLQHRVRVARFLSSQTLASLLQIAKHRAKSSSRTHCVGTESLQLSSKIVFELMIDRSRQCYSSKLQHSQPLSMGIIPNRLAADVSLRGVIRGRHGSPRRTLRTETSCRATATFFPGARTPNESHRARSGGDGAMGLTRATVPPCRNRNWPLRSAA